jgi:putative component of membrane protein insertase Oxa1/YidC/SpoIIIJ protein YidD
MKIINLLSIGIIRFLRPLLGPSTCCKYVIGCGQYAVIQLQDLSFHRAVIAIIKRLIACSSLWNKE